MEDTAPVSLSSSLACSYAHICSGCDLLFANPTEISVLRQTTLKSLDILSRTPAENTWISNGQLRNYLEYTFVPATKAAPPRFGIYEKSIFRGLDRRHVVDLAGCPQLAPQLESWLHDFRKTLPPLKKKASIRLRTSPSGTRGIWIDTANEEIRDLLDEKVWLASHLEKGTIIEIGQRRKRLNKNSSGELKLQEPTLSAWFQTLDNDLLYGAIATFTQPGWQSSAVLTQAVLDFLEQTSAKTVLEFGSGNGGFTLPLLRRSFRVFAFEFDSIAIAGLKMGVQQTKTVELIDRLQIYEGDFIQTDRSWNQAQAVLNLSPNELEESVILVDPPRSGLGKFLDTLLKLQHLPHQWIYVSCYPQTFAKDLEKLKHSGFQLSSLKVIEQFPHTHHFETVALITR